MSLEAPKIRTSVCERSENQRITMNATKQNIPPLKLFSFITNLFFKIKSVIHKKKKYTEHAMSQTLIKYTLIVNDLPNFSVEKCNTIETVLKITIITEIRIKRTDNALGGVSEHVAYQTILGMHTDSADAKQQIL